MDALSAASVLVTGGAGFVGSNLVRLMLSLGARSVHVVDNLLSSEHDNLPSDPRVEFTEGSIADDATTRALADRYDFIFHLCTYHGNQSSIHDPLADHEHNQLTTLKLYERVRSFSRLKMLVYTSAGCAVAEKTFDRPSATQEEAPVSLRMDSPYSISKIVGEFYSVYYRERHGTPIVRARFQNVYGPGEVLGAGRWRGTPATVWRNVVPTFIYLALKGGVLPLEGGGGASRDLIFVEDVCRGLAACATRGKPGDVYNIASGVETTIKELAERINLLVGNRTPPVSVPGREWDRSGRRFGSPVKSKAELGFEALVGLDVGLRRTVSWTRESLARIETCIARHADRLAECRA